MLYDNFKLSNSQDTNMRVNKERNNTLFKTLMYMQGKQDDVLKQKDIVDAALEDIVTSDYDNEALNAFKGQIRNNLSSIDDSKYVGDYDRQINKITNKTKKGIEEIEGNYKAQQNYIAEARKAGLSEESLQKHLALSNAKGGLKYDSKTGQFSNRFSGRALAAEPDLKTTREALATLKSKKFTYTDKNGTQHEIESFDVIEPTEQARKDFFKNNGDSEESRARYLAGVQHYNDIVDYHSSSPEFQNKLDMEREYAILAASKLDVKKVNQEVLKGLMIKYNETNPKLAYAKQLAAEAEMGSLNQLLGFAGLRRQLDDKQSWDERDKFNAETQRQIAKEGRDLTNDIYKMKLKAELDDKYDQKKEARKKEDDFSITLPDAGSVRTNPNIESQDNGLLEERGLFTKLGMKFINYITPKGLIGNNKNGKPFSKEEIESKYGDLGEVAHNIEMRDNPNYQKAQKVIDNVSSTKEQKEDAKKAQERIIEGDKERLAKEMQGITKYQVPLTKVIGKKASEQDKLVLEQLIGDNLNGWARSYRAKKIGEDGEVSPATDFGTLLKDSDIDFDSKEFKKAINGDSKIVSFDGYVGSDGDLERGIQITLTDPEKPSKKETYVLEVAGLPTRAYEGKNSILTEKEAAIAKQKVRHETPDGRVIQAYTREYGTIYKVYNKKGDLLDTYTIDRKGNKR